MHPSDFQPYSNEPSEADLRKMLEERELELELERQRKSRILTKILCVFAVVFVASILGFLAFAPSAPPKTANHDDPLDLKKKFNLDEGDVHFGGELFDYIRPRATPPPKPAAPAPQDGTAGTR